MVGSGSGDLRNELFALALPDPLLDGRDRFLGLDVDTLEDEQVVGVVTLFCALLLLLVLLLPLSAPPPVLLLPPPFNLFFLVDGGLVLEDGVLGEEDDFILGILRGGGWIEGAALSSFSFCIICWC